MTTFAWRAHADESYKFKAHDPSEARILTIDCPPEQVLRCREALARVVLLLCRRSLEPDNRL